MSDSPPIRTPVNHVAPVPRRIRGYLAGAPVVDTTRARYVWEVPSYPQYHLPLADIGADLLVDEGRTVETPRGTARVHGVRVGDTSRPSSVLVYDESPLVGVAGTARFHWAALDAWFEEDEQVYVHPRDPYCRVDAIRSSRHITVALDGVELASSHSPVMVFETGLPTRYYLNPTDVRLDRLEASDTETACPYKGTTSGYWSASIGGRRYADIAWTYAFPTLNLTPIAGLIAFYNEKVDIAIDDESDHPSRTEPA